MPVPRVAQREEERASPALRSWCRFGLVRAASCRTVAAKRDLSAWAERGLTMQLLRVALVALAAMWAIEFAVIGVVTVVLARRQYQLGARAAPAPRSVPG